MVKKELGIETENYPDLAFFLKNSSLNKDEIFKKCLIVFNLHYFFTDTFLARLYELQTLWYFYSNNRMDSC